MAPAFLSALLSVVLHTLVPGVAAVIVVVMVHGRGRVLGVLGFAVLALGTLATGLASIFLPSLIDDSRLDLTVMYRGISALTIVLDAVGLALLAAAIVVSGRGAERPHRA